MTLLSTYLGLPHELRQIAAVGVSFYHRAIRHGAIYRETVRRQETSEYWTRDEMRQYQSRKLRKLLSEARSGTHFYSQTLGAWTPGELDEIAAELQIDRLPLLEKSILKARTPDFLNRLRRSVASSATSGSTGARLRVQYDRESLQQRQAYVHRHRAWAGCKADARSVRLSGRQIIPSDRHTPPFWIHNPIENQLIVSTYHLNPEHIDAVLDAMIRFEPELLDGYPTAIEHIARACAQRGRALPRLKAVISTAETLTPDLRGSIEDNLGVKVLDYYAASEGVPIIQQCIHGRYHLREETGIFEFIRSDGTAAEPGDTAELVATAFCQWKTILIRYRTGDLMTLPEGTEAPCPCGRPSPWVKSIVGRQEDLVVTPDGRTIGMFSYRTLKHVSGILEAQIVQERPGLFRVIAVLDGSMGEPVVEAETRRVFSSVLGFEPTIGFEYVIAIPRGPNGKFRSVIRNFKQH